MKIEYDFSKGEKGKFYKNNIQINIPVYLEQETMQFLEDIAKKKNKDLNTIVNDILKKVEIFHKLFIDIGNQFSTLKTSKK